MTEKRIASRNNRFFRSLLGLASDPRKRHAARQTLLDGPHLLRALFDAGRQPEHLLISESARQRPSRWCRFRPDSPFG